MVNNHKSKSNSSPRKGRNVKKTNKMNGIPIEEEVQAKADFKFLGVPNQEFQMKGKGKRMGPELASKGPLMLMFGKNNKHKHLNLFDDDIDDEELMKLPFLMPFRMFGAEKSNHDNNAEGYCQEIVDQMRHNTNSLVDEIKESRNVAKQSSEAANKEVIDAIKEMQTELRKTLVEELPKLVKK